MRSSNTPTTFTPERAMGIVFRLDGNALRYVTTGDVEYADGADVLRSGFAAAAAAPVAGGWHLVFDIRESAENRSSDELRGVTELVAAHRDILSGRCALVATNPLHFGLARMAMVFFESLGFEANVLATPAAADAWLAGS